MLLENHKQASFKEGHVSWPHVLNCCYWLVIGLVAKCKLKLVRRKCILSAWNISKLWYFRNLMNASWHYFSDSFWRKIEIVSACSGSKQSSLRERARGTNYKTWTSSCLWNNFYSQLVVLLKTIYLFIVFSMTCKKGIQEFLEAVYIIIDSSGIIFCSFDWKKFNACKDILSLPRFKIASAWSSSNLSPLIVKQGRHPEFISLFLILIAKRNQLGSKKPWTKSSIGARMKSQSPKIQNQDLLGQMGILLAGGFAEYTQQMSTYSGFLGFCDLKFLFEKLFQSA